MKKDFVKPGMYKIRVHLESQWDVEKDEKVTEEDMISECRQHGEMVDSGIDKW